jgi:hypothetical protein
MALAAMIMGIGALMLTFASFVCCIGYASAPLGVAAIVLGFIGMKPGSKGYATAGIITGGVAVVIMVLIIAVAGAFLVFGPGNRPNNPPQWNQPNQPPPPPWK